MSIRKKNGHRLHFARAADPAVGQSERQHAAARAGNKPGDAAQIGQFIADVEAGEDAFTRRRGVDALALVSNAHGATFVAPRADEAVLQIELTFDDQDSHGRKVGGLECAASSMRV